MIWSKAPGSNLFLSADQIITAITKQTSFACQLFKILVFNTGTLTLLQ